MDRNSYFPELKPSPKGSLSARRAWIEIPAAASSASVGWSLSARRAWIEIVMWGFTPRCQDVALRKESVDRNSSVGSFAPLMSVALRKESVDRNGEALVPVFVALCRSPQGERG